MLKKVSLTYADVLLLCQEGGCPACRAVQKAVNSYLDMLLYECVTDPDVHDMLCASWGFCYEHAWLLPKVGQKHLSGVALLYRNLLPTLKPQLFTFPAAKRKWRRFPAWLRCFKFLRPRFLPNKRERRLTAQQHCPACLLREEAEARTLDVILTALAQRDERLSLTLHAAGGLCLPHLHAALAANLAAGVAEQLIAGAQQELARIQADLDEFLRKCDYRFQHEEIGSERESWKHAIRFFVGRETL
jgi:hypothetical protein